LALSAARREDRRQHIVTAAQSLLRDRGNTGFSMTELAARAGVSPATPYNLVGSKGEILRLVVKEEFRSFIDKLSALRGHTPLESLLDATALVVSHYEADRSFYRALYQMTYSSDAPDMHEQMLSEGRALWTGLVRAAVEAGELGPVTRVEPFTDVLLRAMSAVTLGWLSENWNHARFEAEMALSVSLICAGLARSDVQSGLLANIERLQISLQS
jgi:AcrR family transcriptional regulator